MSCGRKSVWVRERSNTIKGGSIERPSVDQPKEDTKKFARGRGEPLAER